LHKPKSVNVFGGRKAYAEKNQQPENAGPYSNRSSEDLSDISSSRFVHCLRTLDMRDNIGKTGRNDK